jgi:hypothetical protein
MDHIKNTAFNSSSTVTHRIVDMGTCLFVKAFLSNGFVYLLINSFGLSRLEKFPQPGRQGFLNACRATK